MTKERLQIKAFHMKNVALGKKVKIENNELIIPTEIEYDKNIFESVEVKIIKPREHNFYVNTIMDVVPISTKVLGRLGEGITHTLTGVYMLLTGANTEGKQMHEFGSSEGILQEQLVLNKARSEEHTSELQSQR